MADVVEFLLAGFTDNSGNPLAGGKVYTYEAGTTTPKATYTDNLGVTPEANPVILDSNGRKQIYASGAYKFVVKTSADVTLYTLDNLYFGSGAGFSFLGTTTGSSNSYVATPSPALSSYVDGSLYVFQANHTNTGAATLNISSLGAKSVSGIAGQIVSGFTYIARYNAGTDKFDIVNPDPAYATTQAEMSALNSAGVPIVVKQAITLTGNLTLTAPLIIEKGGMITTSTNVLTINGPFRCDLFKCFTTAVDKVLFGRSSVEKVYPQWFGAVGDDSTDNKDAINFAIASLATYGGLVFIPAGTYKITGKLNGKSNVSIKGTGDSSVIKSNFSLAQNESLLHLEGTTGSSTSLTADAVLGTRQVEVTSSSGFVVDEYVYLTQGSNKAFLHRVRSIPDATHVEFHEILGYAWLSGDVLLRGTWVENVTVSELRFVGTALSSEDTRDRYEDHGVNIYKAHHCVVDNCSFFNLGSRAVIAIDKCGNCIVSNNRVVKCYDRGLEIHAKTSGCILSNNIVEGGLIGCVIHGIGTVMIGNTCIGQYGTDAGGTLRGSGIGAGDLFGGVIANNTVMGAQREGAFMGSDVYDTVFIGNTIAYSKRDGLTVNGSWISIVGNFFTENGDTLEDAAIQLVAACNNIYISGNHFRGISAASPTTRAIGSASYIQTDLAIGENNYVGYPGSFFNINASTTYKGVYLGNSDTSIKKVMKGTATWDPASITAGSETYTDVTVTGVALGDIVLPPGFTTQLPYPDVIMSATVLSANTVRVSLTNVHASTTYDIASGTLTVMVLRV